MGRLIIVGLLVSTLLSACSDSPSGTDSSYLLPTFDNLWPGGEDAYWTYVAETRYWGGDPDLTPPISTYDSPDEVPPAPEFEEIFALLKDHPTGDHTAFQAGVLTLRLEEEVTLEDGRAARVLWSHYSWEPYVPAKLARRSVSSAVDLSLLVPKFLSRNGHLVRSEDGIFCVDQYGQANSWIFLDTTLDAGHEFHLPISIFPNGASLQGRMLERRPYTSVLTGYTPRAIQCLYFYDSGVRLVVPGGPEPDDRYTRYLSYGVVTYVPGFGPVHCYERHYIDPLDPQLRGLGDITFTLTSGSESP